jgi:hypothetical protein
MKIAHAQHQLHYIWKICIKLEWNMFSGIRNKLQTIASTTQPLKWKENVHNFHKYFENIWMKIWNAQQHYICIKFEWSIRNKLRTNCVYGQTDGESYSSIPPNFVCDYNVDYVLCMLGLVLNFYMQNFK